MAGIKSLKGKTVVLTGAAGGIGSILAKRLFFKEGASLVLVDKNGEKLRELKSEIENEAESAQGLSPSAQVHTFEVDLSSKEALSSFSEDITDHDVDILINNAGIVYTGSFNGMDLDAFDLVLSVNLQAAIRLTYLLLPKLIKSKGFIVNIASGSGLTPFPGLSAYSTSKFGLVGFSETLRTELNGLVGVSTICPAFVKTTIMKSSLLSSKLDTQEGNENRDKFNEVFQQIGTDPSKIAQIIVKAIKKNKGLVVVGFIARFLYNIRKFWPGLFYRINASIYRGFIRDGFVK